MGVLRTVGAASHDGVMLITPRIGGSRDSLLQQLLQAETDLKNVRGRGTTAVDLFNEYLRWANEAVRMLRHSVREADLERLVLTRRYWTIQAMATGPVGMASNLVEVEIDDRTTVFDQARRTTEAEFKRWDERGRLVVADTSFYHLHPDKLDEADLSKVIGSREAPISLVVPMVIIDELEKQKTPRRRSCVGAQRSRWPSSSAWPATPGPAACAKQTSPRSSEVKSHAANTGSTWCSICRVTSGYRSTTTRSSTVHWLCSCSQRSR